MDLGLVAQTVRRVGAATELRAGAERLALSVRLLLPTLQQAGSGASGELGELARDIRSAVAGHDSVTLVLPAAQAQGALPARLEAGTRQFVLPAALRDALFAAATVPAAAAPASAVSQAAAHAAADAGAADEFARAWAVAAQTTASAAQVVGGSGAPRAAHRERNDAPPSAVRFTQPLLEAVGEVHPAAAIAERLRASVERSGLFFESHLAQWASGERDVAEMRTEALRLLPQPPHDSAQRVAAQVTLLQDGAFVVHGPAWRGQPVMLAIEREPHPQADAAPGGDAPVFVARLALDLPQLGPVELRLRLAGAAVSMHVAAAEPQRFADAFGVLGEQLAARGLVPVQMQAIAVQAAALEAPHAEAAPAGAVR